MWGEKTMIFEDENILEDDYPVYGDYLYVADGKLIRSDIFGKVRDLKRSIGANEIRLCNIPARQKYYRDNPDAE